MLIIIVETAISQTITEARRGRVFDLRDGYLQRMTC